MIKEFHFWEFPDNLFILLNKEINDKFFNKMYEIFGTQEKFSNFLGIRRQYINKLHRQKLKDNGKYYSVYIPLKLFKRCIPYIDRDFLNEVEQNISEIRARVGSSVYNPKLPIRESEAVYGILAHIIGDGSASAGKTPYYANTCKELREQFKKDLCVFGDMKIYERKPLNVEYVSFPKAVTDILAHIFDVKFTYPDRIPKSIFTAEDSLKKIFLQALFDDEGTISSTLAIGIHNLDIMKQIKSLIETLNIKTSNVMIHPIPGKTDKIYLTIPTGQYALFQQKIGFNHPEKTRKLNCAILTRNRKQRTRNPDYIENEILKILEIKPSPTIDLANELLFTIHGIEPHLNRLYKDGTLVKGGYKNKVIWDLA